MLGRTTIEPRFFETYHFAEVVKDIVRDPFEACMVWEAFLCDGQAAGLVAPYLRESAFHAFLAFVIDDTFREYTEETNLDQRQRRAEYFSGQPDALKDLDVFTLHVERAMRSHGIDFEPFVRWLKARKKTFAKADTDDLHDYFNDLRLYEPYGELIRQLVRETFYVLFGNRQVLLGFNEVIADHVQKLDEDEREEVAEHFERVGVLKRAYMPEWVRKAVFFRDRGRCVACLADLTGVISLWPEENYDHMVPLVLGGLNDVTNIQLMCGKCNRRKGDRRGFTSETYEDWYSPDDERGG